MRLMLMLKVALLAGLFVASGSLGEAQRKPVSRHWQFGL